MDICTPVVVVVQVMWCIKMVAVHVVWCCGVAVHVVWCCSVVLL